MSDFIQPLLPDAEGRIALGALAKGVSSFRAHREANGKIVLEPIEIDERERWLYENPEALKQVLQGIEDVKAGRVHELKEDFTCYIDEELD